MVATQIELKHSRGLVLLIAAMVVLALASVALATLPATVQALSALVVLIGSGWGLARLRAPLPSLRLKSNGQIQVSVAGADWQTAEVLPGCFVSPGLSVVSLRTATGALHRLTLLPGSAPPEALRRLRVSLRWAPRTRSDTASPGAD